VTPLSPIGHPLRSFALTICGIVIIAGGAAAAQNAYDIDLKELRPAPARPATPAREGFEIELKELKQPVRRAHPARRRHTTKPAGPESIPESGRDSSYTVRPGDNLFLILIRHYGLSNTAAERMIPEVLKRNNLQEARKLSVGQRLIIPLTAKTRISSNKSIDKPLEPAAQVTPPITGAAHPELTITLEAAPPCLLSANIARELGLQLPSLSPLQQPDNVSIGYDDQKLIVSCSLKPAEAYTLERLLSPHGIQLVTFTGDVPPRQVVEELADRLGLDYHLAEESATNELPVTYFFPPADPAEKGVRLTVRPAAAPR